MSGEGIEQRGRLVGAARFGEYGVEFTKGVRIAREIEARQGEHVLSTLGGGTRGKREPAIRFDQREYLRQTKPLRGVRVQQG